MKAPWEPVVLTIIPWWFEGFKQWRRTGITKQSNLKPKKDIITYPWIMPLKKVSLKPCRRFLSLGHINYMSIFVYLEYLLEMFWFSKFAICGCEQDSPSPFNVYTPSFIFVIPFFELNVWGRSGFLQGKALLQKCLHQSTRYSRMDIHIDDPHWIRMSWYWYIWNAIVQHVSFILFLWWLIHPLIKIRELSSFLGCINYTAHLSRRYIYIILCIHRYFFQVYLCSCLNG